MHPEPAGFLPVNTDAGQEPGIVRYFATVELCPADILLETRREKVVAIEAAIFVWKQRAEQLVRNEYKVAEGSY